MNLMKLFVMLIFLTLALGVVSLMWPMVSNPGWAGPEDAAIGMPGYDRTIGIVGVAITVLIILGIPMVALFGEEVKMPEVTLRSPFPSRPDSPTRQDDDSGGSGGSGGSDGSSGSVNTSPKRQQPTRLVQPAYTPQRTTTPPSEWPKRKRQVEQ